MSVALRNVLITDAVDSACVDLLQSHGINVTCKYKLPKDQLLEEIKVSPVDNYEIHISCL
jgi:D-3-phosphoglycerate dehydrogenase